MKALFSTELDGTELEYILDIGKRSNAYLSVKDGRLTVKLPYGGTRDKAEGLIAAHKDWVIKKLQSTAQKSRLPENFIDGETFDLLGNKVRLGVEYAAQYRPPHLSDGRLTVYIREGMDACDVKRLFTRYIYQLCEDNVMNAFKRYGDILGLYPSRVTLKNMVSRWGSCSSNGSISINVNVICFEQKCIDYVVIHELCHLKYMDHGSQFWELVETCCPCHRQIREIMKH